MHSPVDGHLCCFHFLIVMNNDAKTSNVWALFSFLLGRYREAKLLSHDSFNFLRNCQTIFQRGCTNLYSDSQCIKVSVSPDLYQHVFACLLQPYLLIEKQYLIVLLIRISLRTNDVECLFTCLLAICISPSIYYLGFFYCIIFPYIIFKNLHMFRFTHNLLLYCSSSLPALQFFWDHVSFVNMSFSMNCWQHIL